MIHAHDKKILTLKNFRVFDTKGASVVIKPLTILTGCNSSGKSSIVKSLLLLESYLNDFKGDTIKGNDIEIFNRKLDFTLPSNISLGNFSRVKNSSSKSNEVTYELNVYSHLLGENVIVTLVFSSEKNDKLKNGYLKSLSFAKGNGTVFYRAAKDDKDTDDRGDLSLILNNFIRHIYIEYSYRRYRDSVSKEEKDKIIQSIQGTYGENCLFDIEWYLKNSYYSYDKKYFIKDGNIKAIQKYGDNGILCYLPILEELNTDIKTIRSILRQKVRNSSKGKETKEKIEKCIDKELELFQESKKETFIEYYKDLELSFIKANNRDFPSFWTRDLGSFLVFRNLLDNYCLQPAHTNDAAFHFEILYHLLVDISNSSDNDYYSIFYGPDGFPEGVNCILKNTFASFAQKVCEQLLEVEIPLNIKYLGSTTAPIRRTYSLEERGDFIQQIKDYLEACRSILPSNEDSHISKKWTITNIENVDLGQSFNNEELESHTTNKLNPYQPGSFMNKWVKEFGIGECFNIEVDKQGLGFVTIGITKNNDKEELISEQGYGITQLFYILLRIETLILQTKNNLLYSLDGSPFSTSLGQEPILPHTIAIEEPEIHFHPNHQSKLAEMFVDAYTNHHINFLIETHSEYLIRKLQSIIANNKGKEGFAPSAISIVYIDSPDKTIRKDNEQVKNIQIKENGILSEPFGEGFFDEARNLALDVVIKSKLISAE